MSYLESAFPAVVNTTDFDLIMYNRITNGLTDITAAMAAAFDTDDNVSLAAGKAIEWGSVSKLTFSSSKVQVDNLEVASPWSFGTLSPTGDCLVSNDFTINGLGQTLTLTGNLSITGIIITSAITDSTVTIAQIAEPGDPPDEHSVIWCSNGTGAGNVGDIMLKIQHGSVVKSKTLVTFV